MISQRISHKSELCAAESAGFLVTLVLWYRDRVGNPRHRSPQPRCLSQWDRSLPWERNLINNFRLSFKPLTLGLETRLRWISTEQIIELYFVIAYRWGLGSRSYQNLRTWSVGRNIRRSRTWSRWISVFASRPLRQPGFSDLTLSDFADYSKMYLTKCQEKTLRWTCWGLLSWWNLCWWSLWTSRCATLFESYLNLFTSVQFWGQRLTLSKRNSRTFGL